MNRPEAGGYADDDPATNVVPFERRVLPLTRAEVAEVRQMLEEFKALKRHCPTARRLIGDD